MEAAVQNIIPYPNGESLAAKVSGYIASRKSSINAISKEIGYSRVTLSRYLAGKYDSNPADIEARLAAFLTKELGEPVEVPPPPEPGQKRGNAPGSTRAGTRSPYWACAGAARSTPAWASW